MLSDNNKLPHLNALGLKYNPFPVVPDSHNYFTTEEMFTEISDILHCIDARKGFILISGEVGLGKTTLSRLLLQKLELKKINTSLVLNTFLQSGSLLKAINNDFNIHIDSEDISDQLDALNAFLLDQYSQDKNCVIVIDDAQQLNFESLELIRQLSNLETNQNKLVQIILVAQSEILDTLNRNDLRQLKSRIALNLRINPLSLIELEQYIEFRLVRAGSNGRIKLEKNALKLLHKLSDGYPRQINLVMDRCLYVVAATGNNLINKNLIAQAHSEISLSKPKSQSHLPAYFNRKFAWASVFVALLGAFIFRYHELILTGFSSQLHKQNTQANNEIKVENLANVKQKFIIEEPQLTHSILTETNEVNETNYLEQFGLASLKGIFIDAIKQNDFSQLNGILKNQYEYQLLLSDKKIYNDNPNEIWHYKYNDNLKWLTFWKPNISVEAFYQGYYSKNIEQLQNNLQSEGFYRSIVDGVVGEKTIIAVSKFQKSVGINASGFPDDITLYQLQKLNESSLNISTDFQKINKHNKVKKSNLKVNKKPTYSLANNSIITD